MNKGIDISLEDEGEIYRRTFAENPEKTLVNLYNENLESFLVYAQRYSQDEHLKTDAFQEGIIAFYEYTMQGKYDPQKSSPKTMIFNMSLRYLNNRIKKERRIISKDQVPTNETSEWIDSFEIELNSQEQEMKRAFQQLGNKCQKLLRMFYYQNLDIESIVKILGYKNANTVSAHKSRCVKQLKSIIHKK